MGRPSPATSVFRGLPSTNSMTIYISPLSSPTSCMVQMFGWLRGGRRAGFVQQILSRGVRGDGALAQNLEGHIAMEKFIACAVDDAHAAFAELRINTIVAEDLANHG